MSAKHTPGPWDWDCGLVPPDGPRRYADIFADHGDIILAHFNDLIPEGKANARLIAAAPDLLEALKVIEAALVAGGDDLAWGRTKLIDAARAAIAHATGEQG